MPETVALHVRLPRSQFEELKDWRSETKIPIGHFFRHIYCQTDWKDTDKKQVIFSVPLELFDDLDQLRQHMIVAVSSLLVQLEDDNWRERTKRWNYNRHQNLKAKKRKAELAKQSNTAQDIQPPSSEDGGSHPKSD